MDRSAKVAAAALVILAISATLFACYPSFVRAVYQTPGDVILQAHVLKEEPAAFIPLDNPDCAVLQAISNPEEHLLVSQDETEILNLTRAYDTSNIKVNGSFYQIYVAFVDYGPPMYLAIFYPISIAGIVGSLFVLVIVGLAKKFPPPKRKQIKG